MSLKPSPRHVILPLSASSKYASLVSENYPLRLSGSSLALLLLAILRFKFLSRPAKRVKHKPKTEKAQTGTCRLHVRCRWISGSRNDYQHYTRRTEISCIRKGTEPYIPVAKARGLSALSGEAILQCKCRFAMDAWRFFRCGPAHNLVSNCQN